MRSSLCPRMRTADTTTASTGRPLERPRPVQRGLECCSVGHPGKYAGSSLPGTYARPPTFEHVKGPRHLWTGDWRSDSRRNAEALDAHEPLTRHAENGGAPEDERPS